MISPCTCEAPHPTRRIVLTGGPGAGKTPVLELVRRYFCKHVRVLPETASILFGGGFPREESPPSRQAAQRAIFHVRRQLELLVGPENRSATTLCDRGTLDGLAYWPGPLEQMLAEAAEALRRLRDELPACCRGHEVPEVDARSTNANGTAP